MAARTEFKRDPPPVMPTDLIGFVCEYYRRRYIPESVVYKTRDDLPEYCAQAPNLVVATRRAVRSMRPNGKRHNHQSKVFVLPEWEDKLTRTLVQDAIGSSLTFHELLLTLDTFRIKGIGPTTTYDVATRIGAFLLLEPKRLYLHAGVTDGIKALGLYYKNRIIVDPVWPDIKWLNMKELPSPLRSMPPNDAEDFICWCREYLSPEIVFAL